MTTLLSIPRRLLAVLASLGTIVLLLWVLPQLLNPVRPSRDKQDADRRWIDTSPSWADRQACRWLGVCGIAHLREDPPEGRFGQAGVGEGEGEGGGGGVELGREGAIEEDGDGSDERVELRRRRQRRGTSSPPPSSSIPPLSSEAGGNKTALRSIPQYVLDHAPLVHLYSGEHFWPSDIAEHLEHMVPRTGGSGRSGVPAEIELEEPLSLDNLAKQLNSHLRDGTSGGGGEEEGVFLSSEVDVEMRPEWLHSWENVPNEFGKWKDGGEDGSENDQCSDGNGSTGRTPGFLADSTTWFDVDKNHPLNRISDPRRKPAGYHDDNRVSQTTRTESNGVLYMKKQSRAFHSGYTPSTNPSPRSPYPNHNDNTRAHYHDSKNRPSNSTGYSSAPATLILVDKGSGVLDAFWFFFYAYNLGQTVLGLRYGNHVGDWEHTMIRFENGVPQAVYFSEHEGGQAYSWGAVEKRYQHHHHRHHGRLVNYTRSSSSNTVTRAGNADFGEVTGVMNTCGPARPVIYSAVGSHAMYASPGDHPYVLPFKMLRDVTDRGPLWDPALNFRSYWYDYTADTGSASGINIGDDDDIDEIHGAEGGETDRGLTPTLENPRAPTDWFHYTGSWGDDTFRLDDERQYRLFGQYHYVAGPEGPKAKNLGRSRVCQADGVGSDGRRRPCRMIYSLEEGRRRSWHS